MCDIFSVFTSQKMTVWISVLILLAYQVGVSDASCGISGQCQHQGSCLNTECQCVQGYIGDLCEHEVQFSVVVPPSYEVEEADGSIVISLSRPVTGFELSLTVETLGTATKDADYSLQDSVVFPHSSSTVMLTITVIDDDDAENDETVIVKLTAEDGTAVETTYTIKASDLVVTLPEQMGVSEGSLSQEIKISRTMGDSEVTVQVNTQDGTATAGTDYTALTNHDVTFAAGSLIATFTVAVTDNEEKDGDRTFTLQVSGAGIKTSGPHTFVILDDDSGRMFDCRRHDSACTGQNDVCDTLPMCKCVGTPAREGDMCNIITGQKNGATCTANSVDCNNNGVCLDDGGTTSCACYPRYYGDNCEYDRLEAVCLKEAMIFIANPHTDFSGSIYVQGKAGNNICVASTVNDPADQNDDIDDAFKGYAVRVPHKSQPCGEISPEELEEDGTQYIIYKRKFFIQYETNPNIATALDQIVTVICKVNKNNLVVNAGVVTLDPESQFTEESRSNSFNPLTLEVRSNAGLVTDATTLLISAELCITLSINEELGSLEIRYIEFNNTLPDAPEKWKIYDEGCYKGNHKLISFNGPDYTVKDKNAMKFCFTAFTFMKSTKLTIEMKVRICRNPSNCQLRDCSVLRRKRQADSSREETVGKTFTLSSGSDQANGSGSNQTGFTEVEKGALCKLPFEFVPTVVSLAVVILFLVLLCLFLTYRLVRKPALTKKKPTDSVYYKR